MRSASKRKFNSYLRPLVSSAMVAGGLLQLAVPIYAAPAVAGTGISNTATASYEDPSSGATTSTISNTVSVTVAEVAGVTITNSGITNITSAGSPLVAGNEAYFTFTVTNIGNDTTNFSLPGTANTKGDITAQSVEYLDPVTSTWKTITAATQTTVGKTATNGFAPGESIQVRVKAKINNGGTGKASVFLGNTPSNSITTPTGDSNIVYSSTGADVFTVDSEGGASDATGAPVDTREASNFQEITIGTAPKPLQAFATVFKTSAYAQGANPSILTDDRIAYDLKLQVSLTSPDSTKEAGDLAAVPLTIDTVVATKKVLVSDAIPAGAILESASAPAGSGWSVVYTTDALTVLPEAASWTTTMPSSGVVTRVGFIHNGPLVKGSLQDNLKVTVKLDTTSTIFTTGDKKVANIAQVFGNTIDPATNLPSTDVTKKVYDESGDQVANDGTTPDGTANSADPDTNGNNTGTGSGGESNVVTVSSTVVAQVLNGPAGYPNADGPTSKNDDFTNRSVAIDPIQAATLQFNSDGTPKSGTGLIDPAAKAFGNTIKNTGAAPSTYTIVPNGNPEGLLDGTVVTVTDTASGKSATYTLSDAATTPVWTISTVPGMTPVAITVAAGAEANYSIQLDLPTGSEQLKGYGVPIVAYVEDTTSGFQGTEVNNVTIDRVYTGYLKLKKEAKVISGADGSIKVDWTTNPLVGKVLPTDKIEYRITYENISSNAPALSNSVELNARNVEIVEDGATGTNTWAAGTEHVPGLIVKANDATVTYAPVNADTDLTVTKYTYKLTSELTPGQTGTFQFTRVVK